MIWESTSPPVHLWWFSERSIKYMAKKLGSSVNLISFEKYFSDPQNSLLLSKKECIKRINSPILDSYGKIIKLDIKKAKEENITSKSTQLYERAIATFKDLAKTSLKNAIIKRVLCKTGSYLNASKKCNYLAAEIRRLSHG